MDFYKGFFLMSPKLQRVANYYLSGLSMRESLLKVGYSDAYAGHNATKFLKNREVIAYIKERQKAEADAALADAIFIKDNLMKIIKDPNSTTREKTEALKTLDNHNEWNKLLESKLNDIEHKQESQKVTIDFNIVKKDEH